MSSKWDNGSRRGGGRKIEAASAAPDEILGPREARGAIEWEMAGPSQFTQRSGTYHYSSDISLPFDPNVGTGIALRPASSSTPHRPLAFRVPNLRWFEQEEVRLDIDRFYPQMAISGTRWGGMAVACHWVAQLTLVGAFTYEGAIFFFDPPDAQLFNYVQVIVDNMSGGQSQRSVKVRFSASMGSSYDYEREYSFRSPYFHKVEFEYDYVSNAVPVTSFDTANHPHRPTDLPGEVINIETVFGRAGFDVTLSGGDSAVPLSDAGSDALWTNQELHDAMQLYWLRYAAKPQWSMWVLFAGLYYGGNNQGGLMFDDIGPYQRQGAAIFLNATTNNPPSGDPSPSEWRDRMRFWTAIHEMGHAFNLAHSFQKTGTIHSGPSWINMADEPHARSFMNYPGYISGGQASYFYSFYYRFSDQDLLFLRHAPSRFVEAGNEAFFTNHGYLEAARNNKSDFELRLTPAAPGGRFAYLVPPVVEMEIVYGGERPVVVPVAELASDPGLTLIIAPEGRPAKRWLPYTRHCRDGEHRVLRRGDAIHDSIMIGVGRGGWEMSTPGRYRVQAVLRIGGQTVYSNQLLVTVEAPASRAEERLSVDIFTPEVGQVLAINGSRGLQGVNDTLAKALELRDNPLSALAAMALATPLAYEFKQLEFDDRGGAPDDEGGCGMPQRRFTSFAPDPRSVRELLSAVWEEGRANILVATMGHARYLREAAHLVAALDRGREESGTSRKRPERKFGLPIDYPLTEVLEAKRATLAG